MAQLVMTTLLISVTVNETHASKPQNLKIKTCTNGFQSFLWTLWKSYK